VTSEFSREEQAVMALILTPPAAVCLDFVAALFCCFIE